MILIFILLACKNSSPKADDTALQLNDSLASLECEFEEASSVQIDSYGIVSHLIPGLDAEESPNVIGARVTECLSQNTTTTANDGTFQLRVPDSDWIELDVYTPETLPSRWIYNPHFEGPLYDPYVNTLIEPASLSEVGLSFDMNKAILVIDAILASDNNASHDLLEADIVIQNQHEAKLPAEDEHVFFNVMPGTLMAEITAPSNYTCLPAPEISIHAGEVINLSLYCLLSH